MNYRRPKSDAHQRSREWATWIERNRSLLKSLGLPAVVYLDEPHWHDFLENGYMHWHEDPSGFSFDQLPPRRLADLGRFLTREHGDDDCPPLLRWIRVRCRNLDVAPD